MSYEQFKLLLMPTPNLHTGPRKFLAGSAAGCTAVIMTYPFDLVRVRLAFETGRGPTIRTICSEIWREGTPSIFNFYRGFVPTVVGMIPYAGVSFWTYESLKGVVGRYGEVGSWSTLACGAVAGILAQSVSYPFEVVRRHIQVSGISNASHRTMIGTGKDIIARRGFGGLYVGLGIGFMKVVPLHAVSFLVYERAKVVLGI